MRSRTTVELGGRTATGLQVPDDIVAALDGGKRAAVVVTVLHGSGYSYRTTVASMGGRFLVPLAAEHRAAAGVTAGDEVDVEIALDLAPREVTVPGDLAQALAADEPAARFFTDLAHSHRKEWVWWIEEAKRAETRTARIAAAVEALREGRRTR